jgi:hypothetical protein
MGTESPTVGHSCRSLLPPVVAGESERLDRRAAGVQIWDPVWQENLTNNVQSGAARGRQGRALRITLEMAEVAQATAPPPTREPLSHLSLAGAPVLLVPPTADC